MSLSSNINLVESFYHILENNYASVIYAQKFAKNAFKNFPKFLPIMLFMLPVTFVLCSNVNNIDVKILMLECSIRVFTTREQVALSMP